jgi:hypothetical protein
VAVKKKTIKKAAVKKVTAKKTVVKSAVKKAVKPVVKSVVKKAVKKKVEIKKVVSKKDVKQKAEVKKVEKKAAIKKEAKPTKVAKAKKAVKEVKEKIVKVVKEKVSAVKGVVKNTTTKKDMSVNKKTSTVVKKVTTKKKPVIDIKDILEKELQASEPAKEYDELVLKKYETGAHSAHTGYSYDVLPTQDLPGFYGMDRAIILPVDPTFAFIYWEATEYTMHKIHEQYGFDSKLIIRVYDVTNIEFNGHNANDSWDLEVYHRIGSWYIKHGRGDRNLLVDLGLRFADGSFRVVARGKTMYFPRSTMVAPGKILWMLVDEFGNKVISDVEEYTEQDLQLLKYILGEEKFKKLLKGDLDIFAGASAWGRIPAIENYIDLSKLPSSRSGTAFLTSNFK